MPASCHQPSALDNSSSSSREEGASSHAAPPGAQGASKGSPGLTLLQDNFLQLLQEYDAWQKQCGPALKPRLTPRSDYASSGISSQGSIDPPSRDKGSLCSTPVLSRQASGSSSAGPALIPAQHEQRQHDKESAAGPHMPLVGIQAEVARSMLPPKAPKPAAATAAPATIPNAAAEIPKSSTKAPKQKVTPAKDDQPRRRSLPESSPASAPSQRACSGHALLSGSSSSRIMKRDLHGQRGQQTNSASAAQAKATATHHAGRRVQPKSAQPLGTQHDAAADVKTGKLSGHTPPAELKTAWTAQGSGASSNNQAKPCSAAGSHAMPAGGIGPPAAAAGASSDGNSPHNIPLAQSAAAGGFGSAVVASPCAMAAAIPSRIPTRLSMELRGSGSPSRVPLSTAGGAIAEVQMLLARSSTEIPSSPSRVFGGCGSRTASPLKGQLLPSMMEEPQTQPIQKLVQEVRGSISKLERPNKLVSQLEQQQPHATTTGHMVQLPPQQQQQQQQQQHLTKQQKKQVACISQQQQKRSHLVKHLADAALLLQAQGGEHGEVCQGQTQQQQVPANPAAQQQGKQQVLAKQEQLKQQESANQQQQKHEQQQKPQQGQRSRSPKVAQQQGHPSTQPALQGKAEGKAAGSPRRRQRASLPPTSLGAFDKATHPAAPAVDSQPGAPAALPKDRPRRSSLSPIFQPSTAASLLSDQEGTVRVEKNNSSNALESGNASEDIPAADQTSSRAMGKPRKRLSLPEGLVGDGDGGDKAGKVGKKSASSSRSSSRRQSPRRCKAADVAGGGIVKVVEVPDNLDQGGGGGHDGHGWVDGAGWVDAAAAATSGAFASAGSGAEAAAVQAVAVEGQGSGSACPSLSQERSWSTHASEAFRHIKSMQLLRRRPLAVVPEASMGSLASAAAAAEPLSRSGVPAILPGGASAGRAACPDVLVGSAAAAAALRATFSGSESELPSLCPPARKRHSRTNSYDGQLTAVSEGSCCANVGDLHRGQNGGTSSNSSSRRASGADDAPSCMGGTVALPPLPGGGCSSRRTSSCCVPTDGLPPLPGGSRRTSSSQLGIELGAGAAGGGGALSRAASKGLAGTYQPGVVPDAPEGAKTGGNKISEIVTGGRKQRARVPAAGKFARAVSEVEPIAAEHTVGGQHLLQSDSEQQQVHQQDGQLSRKDSNVSLSSEGTFADLAVEFSTDALTLPCPPKRSLAEKLARLKHQSSEPVSEGLAFWNDGERAEPAGVGALPAVPALPAAAAGAHSANSSSSNQHLLQRAWSQGPGRGALTEDPPNSANWQQALDASGLGSKVQHAQNRARARWSMPDVPEGSVTLIDAANQQEQQQQQGYTSIEQQLHQQVQLPAVVSAGRQRISQLEQPMLPAGCWAGGLRAGVGQLEQQQAQIVPMAGGYRGAAGQRAGLEPWQQQQQQQQQKEPGEPGMGRRVSCNDGQPAHRQAAPWVEYEGGMQVQQHWLPVQSTGHMQPELSEPYPYAWLQQQQQDCIWQQQQHLPLQQEVFQPQLQQHSYQHGASGQYDYQQQQQQLNNGYLPVVWNASEQPKEKERFGMACQWTQSAIQEVNMPLYLQEQQQDQGQQQLQQNARPPMMLPALPNTQPLPCGPGRLQLLQHGLMGVRFSYVHFRVGIIVFKLSWYMWIPRQCAMLEGSKSYC